MIELLYAYDSVKVEKSEAAAAVAEIADDAAAAEASQHEEAPASKLPKPVEKVYRSCYGSLIYCRLVLRF